MELTAVTAAEKPAKTVVEIVMVRAVATTSAKEIAKLIFEETTLKSTVTRVAGKVGVTSAVKAVAKTAKTLADSTAVVVLMLRSLKALLRSMKTTATLSLDLYQTE